MKNISLTGKYPERVKLGWLQIRVKFSFWRVIKALEINEDSGLSSEDKIKSISGLFVPWSRIATLRIKGLIVRKAFDIIFSENIKKESSERYMDLQQDAPFIRAAFLQAYGIDLNKSSMHWLQFKELLDAIPADTTFAKIVDLRRRPIPKPTQYNQEEIKRLTEAKAAVAIKISEEERRDSFMQSLKNSTIMRG